MTTVTVFYGTSFDGGDEWGDLDFLSVPNVGDWVRIAGDRKQIIQVEHFVGDDRVVRVRVLLPEPRAKYKLDNLI